ncbi:MAG: class I SAM-dependent methyltransferase, partial [Acidimicrobiales bacterium]
MSPRANRGVARDRSRRDGQLRPTAMSITRSLFRLWVINVRIGWPERLRGLHYWLGWEYAALSSTMRVGPGATVVDIGSGAHSTWPYLLAHLRGVHVIATDIEPALTAQRRRRLRAERAGLLTRSSVSIVRCDARRLPFRTGAVDAVTAVSTIEHVRHAEGDRRAATEIARILESGGLAWLTVPYRSAGSMIELDDALQHFQRHYSPDTLDASLLRPAGLIETHRLLYGERLPFYDAMRRVPGKLRWAFRPWDTFLSMLLIHPTAHRDRASAALLEV